MEELKEIISNNISLLRKSKKLTQVELSEKLNYSDKAVSKWERAESLPDIIVLKQIADFFGVTVDYLLVKHSKVESITNIISKENTLEKPTINKFVLSLLGATPTWLIATLIFVVLAILTKKYYWFVFCISIPITLLLFLIFNSIWGNKRFNYLLISLFILSILSCFYIGFLKYNIWQVFILMIPSQVIIFLWSKLKKIKK